MTTIPAQKLRMGSTTYYLASMTARELVFVFRTAAEIWEDDPNLSIEDRIQRDVNRMTAMPSSLDDSSMMSMPLCVRELAQVTDW